ncbi:MAG: PIN domain nuclease [Chloroflexi bacterium]|nr:PIN domain nuclease [Chloroflexota bacterium]
MVRQLVLRFLGIVILGFGGWRLGLRLEGGEFGSLTWGSILVGALLGLAVVPLVPRALKGFQSRIRQIPAHSFIAATVGSVVGLVMAALLVPALSSLPGRTGDLLPIAVGLVLAFLGAAIMVMRGQEIIPLLGPYLPSAEAAIRRGASRGEPILLDTSAIIDGRIADITQTGFIPGSFLIPRFILDELRHIADSADPMRRTRGRRGLEMLNKIQKESDVPLEVTEVDFEDTPEVDAKLIKLAKTLRCPIITTDFNLNRVAELQGVPVLNINELANAVKSVVLPGEELNLRIVQEGKESGQGVGFLDDGTIVVVEGGKRYLHTQLDIVVTRVLQTVAGRMIFAQPKSGAGSESGTKYEAKNSGSRGR